MTQKFDTLFINTHLATMDPNIDAPYGAIEDGALGVKDGRIAWVGKMRNLPIFEAGVVHDCEHQWMTPGLVDCHTHIVFGGNRAKEFEQRLKGASYEDIARSGGGIVSTVKATRAMSAEALHESAAKRLKNFTDEGVTTIEIKSGYGLDLATEIKMLEAAEWLGDKTVRVLRTFLGAHALPPEFKDDADGYIDLVCILV